MKKIVTAKVTRAAAAIPVRAAQKNLRVRLKKPRQYHHLTAAEREEIAIGLEKGLSQRKIAQQLGRDPSAISRELRRNQPAKNHVRYRAHGAHQRACQRRQNRPRSPRLSHPVVRAFVEEKLRCGWSPEHIAGRLPLEHPGLKTNYETIYQWIYHERRDLIPYLVQARKKRRPRAHGAKKRASKIPGRVPLTERPAAVDTRQEFGHWETDTVVSPRGGKACVAVVVERLSRKYLAVKIPNKTAKAMNAALIRALSPFPPSARRTLTYDNGTENANHQLTNAALGLQSYFCAPYHSWEKGSIENRNGVLRRFFPKRHRWEFTTQTTLDTIIAQINATPLKLHGYHTPDEVFALGAPPPRRYCLRRSLGVR
jgi:IS30 family transposase